MGQASFSPHDTKHITNHQCDDHITNIVSVEDSYGDSLLLRLVLDATDRPYALTNLTSGDDLLPYLYNRQEDTPDLIILDLEMPGNNGFDILSELSNNPVSIRAIPIAIITGMPGFRYVKENYPLCIMDYIRKPCSLPDMQKLLTSTYNTSLQAGAEIHHRN